MQVCNKCKETKELSEFYKNKQKKSHDKTCKKCSNERQRLHRLDYLDAHRERDTKIRKLNPNRIKEWRNKNKEKVQIYERNYRLSHRKLKLQIENNRRAKKKNIGGNISKGRSEELFILQRGKCACCKRPLGEKYHLDHIIPLSRGGSNTDNNVQLLRSECNNQKYNKHPVDFMQERGFLL